MVNHKQYGAEQAFGERATLRIEECSILIAVGIPVTAVA